MASLYTVYTYNMLSKTEALVFSYFSFITEILWKSVNLSPPFLRNGLLRLLLGKFGKNSFIDYGFYVRYPKKLYIGNNCEINRNCEIFPSFKDKETKVKLGNHVILGPNVVIFGAGQSSNLSRLDVSGQVIIEDNVYIGGNSVIRYGVTVGQGSTVAANSTVVKNVPPFSVVGGNPAKIIKKR